MKTLDEKIKELVSLDSGFIYVEWYAHTNCLMYKISNAYTDFMEDKHVLCPLDDGIEKAVDLAIPIIERSFKEWLK